MSGIPAALPAALVAALRGLPVLDDAACRGRGPLWDSDLDGEHTRDRDRRLNLAAGICRVCPARRACADIATDYGPTLDGVWAGRLRHAR